MSRSTRSSAYAPSTHLLITFTIACLSSTHCSSFPSAPSSLCGRCVQKELEAHFGSSIRVSGDRGRSSSFEITGRVETPTGTASAPVLLYSKLSTGKFPDTNAFIAKLQQWASTGKVE